MLSMSEGYGFYRIPDALIDLPMISLGSSHSPPNLQMICVGFSSFLLLLISGLYNLPTNKVYHRFSAEANREWNRIFYRSRMVESVLLEELLDVSGPLVELVLESGEVRVLRRGCGRYGRYGRSGIQ